MNRTIGTTSIDAKVVYEKIKTLAPGETITYDALSEITGRNITLHRHILMTARNTALRENQMVFDCITGVGIKRLSDSEIVSMESVRPMARVRSALRNGVKRITCAKNITNEERIRVNASLSMFSVLAEFSKNKSLDKLQPVCVDLVPFGKVLKMFE
jgi:hypothetical protein